MKIEQTAIQFYRDNGFVQIDDVLTSAELEEIRGSLEEVMGITQGFGFQNGGAGGSYYRVLNQRVNTWRDHGGMAKYVLNPRFAAIASQLLGGKSVRLFHDHALLKMPGDSKPTPWHQDTTYWPMNETGALSIWIALDDVDEQNGCMMFVPNSRSLGKLDPIDLVNPQDIFEYAKGSEIEGTRPVIVRMKAGSCTFHDGLTFHYAHPNVTEKPRRALAIIYMPDGTTFNGGGHAITDGCGLHVGQPIRGPLFPILNLTNCI